MKLIHCMETPFTFYVSFNSRVVVSSANAGCMTHTCSLHSNFSMIVMCINFYYFYWSSQVTLRCGSLCLLCRKGSQNTERSVFYSLCVCVWSKHSPSCCCCYFLSWFCLLGQGLTVYILLTWNLLSRPDWPQTHGKLSASASECWD